MISLTAPIPGTLHCNHSQLRCRRQKPSLELQFNSRSSRKFNSMAMKGNDGAVILTSGASGRLNALLSARALRSLLMLVNAFVMLLLLPFRGRKRSVLTVPAVSSSEKGAKEEAESVRRKGAVVRVPTKVVPWKSTASAAVALDQEVAARRALAIKRVTQDQGNESVREFSLFVTSRGDTMFTQSWTPVSVKVRISAAADITLDEDGWWQARWGTESTGQSRCGSVWLFWVKEVHTQRKRISRNGLTRVLVYLEHARKHLLAYTFKLWHVRVKISTSRVILSPTIFKEFEPDHTITNRCWFASDVARFPHLFADVMDWRKVLMKTLSELHRGVVVLLHGLNEHSDRYSAFAKQLNANGYKVFGMDWIGHGGSDGLHAYVHSLDYAVTDTKSFIGKVLAENPGLPCFCFGHSTGGAIVLKAMLDPKVEKCIAGVVLTSPAVGVQPSHPIFAVLAPVFSFLLPKYQLSAANKKGTAVSRDPEALVAKYSDPLVYTGSVRIRTGYEILRVASYLQQNLSKLKVPLLILHGTADTVTDPEASQKLYKEAASTDKTIKLYEGFLHDLLFEPERGEIVEGIIEWLNCRL
ncbi:hypothetical protein RJ639_032951 [Escallonia herrerae]|uniref:Serine aminopeptidase S33 domain-containing protein n=1 Tax=Escallonia herrerae TaxID=1293975 RepID=A0AA88WVJ1_9ASTE|nr:hypothetical protein RJ639_032951 [Escallonia herrerae]